MAGHEPDDSGQRVPRGPAGSREQPLARLEDAGHVATTPCVGHRERGNFAPRGDEELDLALTHGLSVPPGGDLLDLAREFVEIVSDELDEQTRDRRIHLDSKRRELPPDPAGQIGSRASLRQVVDEQLAGLRDRLGERRVLSDSIAGEGQDRFRRRRFQVVEDRIDVGRLPTFDVLDDDEPSFADEEPERVAGSCDIRSAGLEG